MGFAQNLDHLMQSRGMTKYQLAKELVCHQTSVTNWLENGTVPQKRTLGAIANLFNISVEALCSEELPDIEQKEKPAAVSGELDQVTREIFNIIDSANVEKRKKILALLKVADSMGE